MFLNNYFNPQQRLLTQMILSIRSDAVHHLPLRKRTSLHASYPRRALAFVPPFSGKNVYHPITVNLHFETCLRVPLSSLLLSEYVSDWKWFDSALRQQSLATNRSTSSCGGWLDFLHKLHSTFPGLSRIGIEGSRCLPSY